MTTQSQALRLARSIVQAPFAWPGGYPRFAVTRDGAALCPSCCQREEQSIATTTGSDGWCVVASAINWDNADLRCDHCSGSIPAAYT